MPFQPQPPHQTQTYYKDITYSQSTKPWDVIRDLHLNHVLNSIRITGCGTVTSADPPHQCYEDF